MAQNKLNIKAEAKNLNFFYADGTKATVEQMARDVSTFLQWAAEPELEQRRALGVKIIIFLTILAGLTYAVKRKVWADVEH